MGRPARRVEDRRPQLRQGHLVVQARQAALPQRLRGPTKEQLYNEAKQRNIRGRSKMNKKQLANTLGD
ncbi:hypothetical protein [Streptomyces sp. NPDC002540]